MQRFILQDPLSGTEASNEIPPHHRLQYGLGLLEQRSGYFKVKSQSSRYLIPSKGIAGRISIKLPARWIFGLSFLVVAAIFYVLNGV